MIKLKIIRSILNRYPWIPGATTLIYIAFALLVVTLIVFFPSIGSVVPKFLKFASTVLITGPVVIALLQILNLKHTVTSIPKLALLYMEIILMFGVVYFYAVSDKEDISSPMNTTVIKGIKADWTTRVINEEPDKIETMKQALISFEDCVYFSMVTSTTVGYGDMVPVTPATKLLVGIQVLVSFFLIAFGAGYFFSLRSNGSSKELQEINERLKKLEEKLK